MASENFVVPFGKYKGKKLGDVDDLLYLNWMRGLDNLYDDTKKALEEFFSDPTREQLLDELKEEDAKNRGG
jgi:hypothetical protein